MLGYGLLELHACTYTPTTCRIRIRDTVGAIVQSTPTAVLQAMKNVLQKRYFKNVLKAGFIDPF